MPYYPPLLGSVESLYCHVLESKEPTSCVDVKLAGSLLCCIGKKSPTTSDHSDQTLSKLNYDLSTKAIGLNFKHPLSKVCNPCMDVEIITLSSCVEVTMKSFSFGTF